MSASTGARGARAEERHAMVLADLVYLSRGGAEEDDFFEMGVAMPTEMANNG